MGSGLFDAKLRKIWDQVQEEERSKQDIYSWISKEADERYENSRDNELVLLMRAAENGDLIDRLSHYEAALMSALNRTLQQLWLAQNMRSKSHMITLEKARPPSDKPDRTST